MALPVRLLRARSNDPTDIARSDLGHVLNRLFARGLFGEADEDALAPILNYGVDIREDADRVYIEADLPGFRREEVDISLEGGVLTIAAEHLEESREPADKTQKGQQDTQNHKEPGFLLRERRLRRFVRSFTLPPNVDDQNVQARLENGVLMITLNKRQESKPRHVQIS